METTTAPAPSTAADATLPRGSVLVLAALGLAVFLIANDTTSLTVGLPTLHAGFLVDAALGVLALATALLVVLGPGSRLLNGSGGAVDLRSGGERAAEGTN
jgi:hypothetical protein